MKRKLRKTDSSSCSACTAKKKNDTQLEWGAIFSGALRWLANLRAMLSLYEFVKTWIEHGSPFS